jgi:hypothetical protein
MVVAKAKRKKRTKKSPRDYIDNKVFTEKMVEWKNNYLKELEKFDGNEKEFNYPVTNEIAEDFYKIAKNLVKTSRFSGYTYKDDMIQLSLYYMCKYAKNFKADGTNAFSYFSQICWNGFVQQIKKEYDFSDKKRELKNNYKEELLNDPCCVMDKGKISKIINF